MYRRTRCRVVGHLVHHLAIGLREPEVVLEEIAVPVDMGHHQLLVEQCVGLHQIGVTRIVVDHHLIDLLQPVRVALRQLLVLHAEPPVRIPQGEAAKGRQHAHFFVIDDFKDRRKKVEAVALGPPLDFVLGGPNLRRQLASEGERHGDLLGVNAPGHLPLPRNSLIES